MWIPFYKSSDLAAEEARLADLKSLFASGQITTGEYLSAINQLKQTGERGSPSGPGPIVQTVQIVLLVAIIASVVYAYRLYKQG